MTDDITHAPVLTINDICLNHTYLIRYGNTDIVSSITVLLITDKAYHLRWNRGFESNSTWELKEKLYHDYSLIEDISDFVSNSNESDVNKYYNVKAKFVQCHICKGFGTVPDPGSTSGSKVCPLCLGSKMIPQEITKNGS